MAENEVSLLSYSGEEISFMTAARDSDRGTEWEAISDESLSQALQPFWLLLILMIAMREKVKATGAQNLKPTQKSMHKI